MRKCFLVILASISMFSCDREVDKVAESNVVLSSMKRAIERFSITNQDQLKVLTSKEILRQIILIRSINPQIEELRADALTGLCLLRKNIDVLDFTSDEEMNALALAYLESVEEQYMQKIQRLQKTLKGKGCYIGASQGQ